MKSAAPQMDCDCLCLECVRQLLRACAVVACDVACACDGASGYSITAVSVGAPPYGPALGQLVAADMMGERAAHGTVHHQSATQRSVVHTNSLSCPHPVRLSAPGGADQTTCNENHEFAKPTRRAKSEPRARPLCQTNPFVEWCSRLALRSPATPCALLLVQSM